MQINVHICAKNLSAKKNKMLCDIILARVYIYEQKQYETIRWLNKVAYIRAVIYGWVCTRMLFGYTMAVFVILVNMLYSVCVCW